MNMYRTEILDALKEFGMSPAKALEIAIDVERGDGFATRWLAKVLNSMSKRVDIMTDALTILTAARKIIADPAMWFQGNLTASGRWDTDEPCCALCAIWRAAADKSHPDPVRHAVATTHTEEFTPDQISLAAFNDRPSTKHSDVMAVFDRAIAALEVEA